MSATNYLNISSAIFFLLEVLRYIYFCLSTGKLPVLETLITNALGASSIPVALLLIASCLYPEIMNDIKGINLYFAVAGVCMLFIVIKQIFQY